MHGEAMAAGDAVDASHGAPGQPVTGTCVVVLRAPAGFYLGPDDRMTVRQFPSEVGPVDLAFRTLRAVPNGFRNPVRLGLWVDARGAAPSLGAAVETFGNVARGLAAILSVAANAPSDEPTAEFAYDDTPGKAERAYWQRYLEPPALPAHPGRRLDPIAAMALVRAYVRHPDRDRFHRALAQYHHALQNFDPGLEIPALAHLWVGMEALTPVAVRRELARQGVTADELKRAWSDELTRQRGQPVELRSLDPEGRRRLLFRSDDATYRAAKDASDGYEHGSWALWDVRHRALVALDRTADYLRAAILDLASLGPGEREALAAFPFDRPLHRGVERSLRGLLVGDADELALPGEEYPGIEWVREPIELPPDAEGDAGVGFKERIRADLPAGLSFKPELVEIGAAPPDEEPGMSAEGAAGRDPLAAPA